MLFRERFFIRAQSLCLLIWERMEPERCMAESLFTRARWFAGFRQEVLFLERLSVPTTRRGLWSFLSRMPASRRRGRRSTNLERKMRRLLFDQAVLIRAGLLPISRD